MHSTKNLLARRPPTGPTMVRPELHRDLRAQLHVQGAGDRACYHHLMPQQKINTLRLKLWARVRTYNEQTKTWGMQTIVCPVQGSDYWHVRLHFVEK